MCLDCRVVWMEVLRVESLECAYCREEMGITDPIRTWGGKALHPGECFFWHVVPQCPPLIIFHLFGALWAFARRRCRSQLFKRKVPGAILRETVRKVERVREAEEAETKRAAARMKKLLERKARMAREAQTSVVPIRGPYAVLASNSVGTMLLKEEAS